MKFCWRSACRTSPVFLSDLWYLRETAAPPGCPSMHAIQGGWLTASMLWCLCFSFCLVAAGLNHVGHRLLPLSVQIKWLLDCCEGPLLGNILP